MATIESRLESIMRQIFDQDDLTISGSLTAENVEGWDSLAHVHLIVAMEKEFSVSFSDSDIAGFKTVQSIIDTIQSRQHS